LEAVVLDPAAVVVVLWTTAPDVPVLEAAAEVVLPVAVLGAAVLAVVAAVVFLGVVLAAPVLDDAVGVFWTGVVLAVPVLAVVAEVLGVVVVGAGVCGVSVCARRIAAETKLQIRMIIERFIVHPFEGIERSKVSRPRRQFKNCATQANIKATTEMARAPFMGTPRDRRILVKTGCGYGFPWVCLYTNRGDRTKEQCAVVPSDFSGGIAARHEVMANTQCIEGQRRRGTKGCR
jgi:hypothetical protein